MPRKKKSVVPSWRKLVAGALAAATLAGGAVAFKNLPYFVGEKVVDVIDGDTFVLENHQYIRLLGLNAPELENCLGNESKQALSSLVLGKKVVLREPIADGNRRVMAMVYTDKVLVNDVMVRAGLAEYSSQATKEKQLLYDSNIYARENKIGIFSAKCFQREPPNKKCAIKGNVGRHNTVKTYLRPDCTRYTTVIIEKYQGDDWFCTEKEAIEAGFVKSENCK